MKIVFDIDNTLYSFAETGFGDTFSERIVQFMVDNMNMDREAATQLSDKYYSAYGLAIGGLYRHHQVDLEKYCRYVNQCDYSILKRDERLSATLQHLVDEGHELWFMTNADMEHALRVLDGLEIRPFFANKDGELRGFDCFLQWGHSEPKMQNKPMRGAYEALHRMIDPAQPHEDCVMVDDAWANLEEPKKLGWKTVWVAHGRSWPNTAPFQCDFALNTVHDLPNVPEFGKLTLVTDEA